MKKDRIDTILQLAWLEGWINTYGAYEKALAKKEIRASLRQNARSTLIARLETALAETKPAPPQTVGSMLRSVRANRELRPEEIFSRIGIAQNIYRMMEQDTISPLKISVDVWKRLIRLLDLSVTDLAEMLRRTHQLVLFRPALKGVLARYNAGNGKGQKAATLQKAFTEMYAKAELSIPEDEQRKLNELISRLQM